MGKSWPIYSVPLDRSILPIGVLRGVGCPWRMHGDHGNSGDASRIEMPSVSCKSRRGGEKKKWMEKWVEEKWGI